MPPALRLGLSLLYNIMGQYPLAQNRIKTETVFYSPFHKTIQKMYNVLQTVMEYTVCISDSKK
jgi:predicted N-formylglutamate amidohydrolase